MSSELIKFKSLKPKPQNFPTLKMIAKTQIKIWPEHEPTIATSLGNRKIEILQDAEDSAILIKKICNKTRR